MRLVPRYALAAIPALAGAAWTAQLRADRRAVDADPMHAVLEAPLSGRPLPVTSAGGTRLNVRVFGPDHGPTVVLVHGWTEALRFWTCQIQDLSRDLRVVAYDLRGHGESGRPGDGDYSTDAFADDLDAVLRTAVPDGERAVVAGHSLGAMTLVAWAGRQPSEVERRVAAATLVNTGVGDLITEALVLRTPAPLERAQRLVAQAVMSARAPLPSRSTPVSNRALRYVALSPSASPATVAFCERLLLECPRDVRAACGGTLSEMDLREAVASLCVPTVTIAGQRDRLTPPVHARRLAEELPVLVGHVELPGVGHMAPVEAPDEVTHRIRGLAAAHGGAPDEAVSPAAA